MNENDGIESMRLAVVEEINHLLDRSINSRNEGQWDTGVYTPELSNLSRRYVHYKGAKEIEIIFGDDPVSLSVIPHIPLTLEEKKALFSKANAVCNMLVQRKRSEDREKSIEKAFKHFFGGGENE